MPGLGGSPLGSELGLSSSRPGTRTSPWNVTVQLISLATVTMGRPRGASSPASVSRNRRVGTTLTDPTGSTKPRWL